MAQRMNDDVVGRVVAWHNRHPLAQRIEARHVLGIGWVSLPFAGPPQPVTEPSLAAASPPAAGASLRERAMAAGTAPAPAPMSPQPVSTRAADRAFAERFVEPWRPRRIAAFGARFGRLGGPFDADQPLRDVQADAVPPGGSGIVRRYLRTAAVEIGDRRTRVLLAPDDAAIWGPRLWDRTRLALLAGLSVGLAAVVFAMLRPSSPDVATTLAAAPATSAVVAAPSAAAASVPVVPSVQQPASSAAAAAMPPAAVAAAAVPTLAASAPVATPAPVAGPALDIRPRLTPDQAREARREANALRAAAPASTASAVAASTPRPSPPAVTTQPPPLAPVPPAVANAPRNVQVEGSVNPAASGTVLRPVPPPRAQDLAPGARSFALVARPTRSRAASEVMLGLMKGAYAVAPGRNVEVLPVGEQWRATWWPFTSRRDAEQAQTQLATLGVAVEVVEF